MNIIHHLWPGNYLWEIFIKRFSQALSTHTSLIPKFSHLLSFHKKIMSKTHQLATNLNQIKPNQCTCNGQCKFHGHKSLEHERLIQLNCINASWNWNGYGPSVIDRQRYPDLSSCRFLYTCATGNACWHESKRCLFCLLTTVMTTSLPVR